MTTPAKAFIILRFQDESDPNAYRVRSVPILETVSILGVPGFAVHRIYRAWDAPNPTPGLFRVSHIETGVRVADGDSPDAATQAATIRVSVGGGPEELNTRLMQMRLQLAQMTKLV